MSKKNKISIITASFQSQKTIKDTLDSVNIQSYPNIEHIIIDGASSDGTLDLVKNHGKRVMTVLSEPDKGIFDAYNKGLALCEGEVIGILNSDDFYFEPHVIRDVMRQFEDASVDAVYADLLYVDKDNTDKVVRYWKSRAYRDGDFKKSFSPAHPTLFLRRSVYSKSGGFKSDYRYSGDYEFMLRVFHIHKINSVYLPQIFVKMRTGGATGGSIKYIKKQNLEILRALENHDVKIYKALFFGRKFFDRLVQRLRATLLRVGGSLT